MNELADRHCKPCEGGVEPLTGEQAREMLSEVNAGWTLVDNGACIERRFEFPAYSRIVAFANAVAWVAISEGHHPVMEISYGRCIVRYSTHAIGGLSDNDFICAARIDRLAGSAGT